MLSSLQMKRMKWYCGVEAVRYREYLQLFQIGWSHMASGRSDIKPSPEGERKPLITDTRRKNIPGGKKNTCKGP